MKDLSIYIHIPFCVRKCLYCDFLSFPISADTSSKAGLNAFGGSVQETVESYVNLLRQEIAESAVQYKEYQVLSIFVGGGTPSLLPAETVSSIMEIIREHYRVTDDAEITMEMNPDTVEEDRLREYITSGINRISIGLQSADDDELERIGRIHDYRTFVRAYELARKVGYCNINIDLMAALPEQSVASYMRTLKRVTLLAPEHISAYSLTLEEGTPLYEQRGRYRFPTEDEEREMYALTGEYLASCGYHRYEISNYALDGYECRHNKVYWQRGNYTGFGMGASSMVENVRWTNPADMKQYRTYVKQFSADDGLSVINAVNKQTLTVHEQMEEYMFLGLRMMCGIDEREFADEFGTPLDTVYGDTVAKLCGQGLLTREQGRIRLTERGIDISNYVMAQFLFDEIDS